MNRSDFIYSLTSDAKSILASVSSCANCAPPINCYQYDYDYRLTSNPILPFAIVSANPPLASVLVYYSFPLSLKGGVAPFLFSVSSGSLPPGLSLNTLDGLISGIPTRTGNYTFTVTATDSIGMVCSATYTIGVILAPNPWNGIAWGAVSSQGNVSSHFLGSAFAASASGSTFVESDVYCIGTLIYTGPDVASLVTINLTQCQAAGPAPARLFVAITVGATLFQTNLGIDPTVGEGYPPNYFFSSVPGTYKFPFVLPAGNNSKVTIQVAASANYGTGDTGTATISANGSITPQ